MALELRRKKDIDEARKALLERLDREMLRRIEARFGQYIPEEKLAEAKRLQPRFLSAQEYREHLQNLGLTEDEGKKILGDFSQGEVTLNYEDPRVPGTLVHERLHHLADTGLKDLCGPRLHEGLTERFAQEVSPYPFLSRERQIYPEEQRVVELLWARAGPEALAKAYFRGDLSELRVRLDQDLGPGALERVLTAARNGNMEEAERILKGA